MPFPIEHTIPYYHDHPMRREEYKEHQRHYSYVLIYSTLCSFWNNI
jgi:hypothetical protein